MCLYWIYANAYACQDRDDICHVEGVKSYWILVSLVMWCLERKPSSPEKLSPLYKLATEPPGRHQYERALGLQGDLEQLEKVQRGGMQLTP